MAVLESDQWLRDQLDILRIKARKNARELAAICGISQAAYYNRYANPQEFRLGELRSLDRIAKHYGLRILQEA